MNTALHSAIRETIHMASSMSPGTGYIQDHNFLYRLYYIFKKGDVSTCLSPTFLALHARAALERLPQIDDAHIHKVICSRSEPSHLMVLAQKTLYLSRNDGDSFQRYMRTQNGPFTDAIVENSTSFYVSDTRHIFHDKRTA